MISNFFVWRTEWALKCLKWMKCQHIEEFLFIQKVSAFSSCLTRIEINILHSSKMTRSPNIKLNEVENENIHPFSIVSEWRGNSYMDMDIDPQHISIHYVGGSWNRDYFDYFLILEFLLHSDVPFGCVCVCVLEREFRMCDLSSRRSFSSAFTLSSIYHRWNAALSSISWIK